MSSQEQQGNGHESSAADKKSKNQAEVDSTTHLEDEETNGVTTTPTPKAVEGSQPPLGNPNQGDAGKGETVAPSEE